MRELARKKVFVTGRGNTGWSIDHDRAHAERAVQQLGMTITGTPLTARVIHSVWWVQLMNRRSTLLRYFIKLSRPKVIATVTSSVLPDNQNYRRAKQFVDTWVVGNNQQAEVLRNDGARVAWQPFYVDETIFSSKSLDKQEICNRLGIDYDLLRGKYVIANFQRDTEGLDLATPKTQKDPTRLARILSAIPNRDNWILLLAGPRRHFILCECERLGIPYFYYGSAPQPGVDDLQTNLQSDQTMALLNELTDCSITTSISEGGPKGILEAAYARSFVLTTPVGNAPELFPRENLFDDDDEAITKLTNLIQNGPTEEITKHNNQVEASIRARCDLKATLQRWHDIYRQL